MMNEEGKRESGHLQINMVTLQLMEELHQQLLSSSKYPFYTSEYYKVLPFIVELRNKGANKDEHEIETYTIVGTVEADPLNGKISNESPLASALMDKKQDDTVTVMVAHPYKVKIKEIN